MAFIRWLYEHQGERRFDASNRLFLVLVNRRNYFESWKLKRAKALMEERISKYLDERGNAPGRRINFPWQGKQYSTVSDLLVVRKTPVKCARLKQMSRLQNGKQIVFGRRVCLRPGSAHGRGAFGARRVNC